MAEKSDTTVLIVDDEPNIVIAIEFLMEKEGFTVLKAYDGMEGLKVLEKTVPDIVILDVMMPEMDGFEVAKTIRESPEMDHVQIIFLTAKGTREDKMKGYSSGGEIYLTKPFDNDDLVATVNEVAGFG